MINNELFRTVIYKDIQITYQLLRKPVKNINLRIHADGSLYVSANPMVPEKMIDSLIITKGDYIIKNLRKFKSMQNDKPTPKKYISGEIFKILGKEVQLKVLEREKEMVESDGIYLFLTVREKKDFARKEKLIKCYLDAQCREIFTEIVDKIHPIFLKYNVSMPRIRIRDMKTRWGSCLPGKGIITLNQRLLATPRDCIEYVVLHEFCHFIHPNHSKKFYDLVTRLMPDWKARKDKLDKQGCISLN